MASLRHLWVVLVAFVLFFAESTGSAQDLWLWQPSLPATPRNAALGFALGNRGYVGLGANGSATLLKDLWQLNPDDMSWTQKADFPGLARYAAIVFTIGGDAYVGGGYTTAGAAASDFWRYRASTNAWTPVADFGGGGRYAAVAFELDGRGYVACGQGPTQMHDDLWEYNPSTNAWTRKADLPAAARIYAVGFKAQALLFDSGDVGLVVAGLGNANAVFQDAWAYTRSTNSWTRRADLPGFPRYAAIGYSGFRNSKAYVGGGVVKKPGPTFQGSTDFYQYNASVDSWTTRADLYCAPGGNNAPVTYGAAFGILTKGYVVTGTEDQSGNTPFVREYGGGVLWVDSRRQGTLLNLAAWIGTPGVVATFEVGMSSAGMPFPSSWQVLGASPFDSLGRARITRPIPPSFLSSYNIQRALFVRASATLPGLGLVHSGWFRVQ